MEIRSLDRRQGRPRSCSCGRLRVIALLAMTSCLSAARGLQNLPERYPGAAYIAMGWRGPSSSGGRVFMSLRQRQHKTDHSIHGFREEPLFHITPPARSAGPAVPSRTPAGFGSPSTPSSPQQQQPPTHPHEQHSYAQHPAAAHPVRPSKSRLPSQTVEWQRLVRHAADIKAMHLRNLIQDSARCEALCAEYDGIYMDYSRQQATTDTMKLLFDFARKQDLSGKIQAMARGEKINFTENRAVLHMATRASREESVVVDGVDVVKQVHEVLDKIRDFSDDIRAGKIRGATGKPIRNIIAVGIGGSYLGPACIHEVFKTEEEASSTCGDFRLRFLSNVDPVDVSRAKKDLNPEETLVIIVSKSFTTAETMLNARTMRQWLWDSLGDDPEVVAKHMAACASTTALDAVEAFGIPKERLFEFWDWVGGRYSVCASPGALPISIKFGFNVFQKFLQGARSIDQHFLTAPMERNIPILMGLLGVWNMSFLGYKCRTIIPYAEALMKFPAHIQQVDMESNGKHTTVEGYEIDYEIGEIDFGEPGTNGQHSFFQLLHMGQVVPVDFIGFAESQQPQHVVGEELSSHDELMANFFAQPDALAIGKTGAELLSEGIRPEHIPHRTFKGNRPSLSLLLPKLTAYTTGQLLALYEHRTAVQGFLWHVNSFDQWGVELGKQLAKKIRNEMKAARTGPLPPLTNLVPATAKMLRRYWRGGVGSDDEQQQEQAANGPTEH